MSTPKAADYCAKCNAPHQPVMAVLMRCGACAVINGKLPPNKYSPAETEMSGPPYSSSFVYGYTADQMQDYARAAIKGEI